MSLTQVKYPFKAPLYVQNIKILPDVRDYRRTQRHTCFKDPTFWPSKINIIINRKFAVKFKQEFNFLKHENHKQMGILQPFTFNQAKMKKKMKKKPIPLMNEKTSQKTH